MSGFHKTEFMVAETCSARCLRRSGLHNLASLLRVTHVTDARERQELTHFFSAEIDLDPGPVLLGLEGLT